MRDDFIRRCVDDPAAFLKPLQKQKLMTFSSEVVKLKKKGPNDKIQQARMERDLMGRILATALEKKVDMAHVLSYPLTPIPLCFSHIDGEMNKTPKILLFHCLEKRLPFPCNHFSIDVHIFDGFLLLHLFVDLPLTFGKIAFHVLRKICQTKAKRVDLVFDTFVTPSIKDIERDRRSNSDRDVPFSITGPNKKRPSYFIKALRNDSLKRGLVKIFVESFNDECFCDIIGDKTVRITFETNCYIFTTSGGRVLKELDDKLCSTHEEADTKMILHLSSITGPANVVIRTSDTDLF